MSDVMNHLDLFTGIGGFHLAGEKVWGDEFNTIAHVEIDSFCRKVLKKHWPDVPIISDIKEYKHDGTTIDLLTGGFPCQPFSCAGKQRGKKDDRYLWPEMLRVISEVRPTWIIGENVAGIINMGLDQVLSDLESEDYVVQPFIIPACAVNAPHRRDRVWIVANHIGGRCGTERKRRGMASMDRGRTDNAMSLTESDSSHAPDSNRLNVNNAGYDSGKVSQLKEAEVCGLQTSSDAGNKGLQRRKRSKTHEKRQTTHGSATECNNAWDEPWLEAATRLCRVDDGISRQMDRTNRLKALGNAIVPQVVVPIMQAIKKIKCLTSQQN